MVTLTYKNSDSEIQNGPLVRKVETPLPKQKCLPYQKLLGVFSIREYFAPFFPCFNDTLHLSFQAQVICFKKANTFYWTRKSASTIIQSVSQSHLEASWSQNAPCVQNAKNHPRRWKAADGHDKCVAMGQEWAKKQLVGTLTWFFS